MSKECFITGPYLPVGDTDWECRAHQVEAVLRKPYLAGSRSLRRSDFICPYDDDICDCILTADPQWEGHTRQDHYDEHCTGRWTFDPPCGGCINCIAAQMYYYKSLNEFMES